MIIMNLFELDGIFALQMYEIDSRLVHNHVTIFL